MILGESIYLSGPTDCLPPQRPWRDKDQIPSTHPWSLVLANTLTPLSRSVWTSFPPSKAWLPWALGSEFHNDPSQPPPALKHGGHPWTETLVSCHRRDPRSGRAIQAPFNPTSPQSVLVSPTKGCPGSLYLKAFSDLPASICLREISQSYLAAFLVEDTPRASMPENT